MQITVLGKGYEVSERLRKIIEQKTAKFDKYFNDSVNVKVVCKEERNNKYTMEMTFSFEGQIVRSEVTSDNMYHNIDLALPKIEGQIRKYKSKLDKKVKQDAFAETFYAQDEQDQIPKVVKQKMYELMHISVADAIAEMELLDNSFYVFINNKTEKVNVIYKRKDGDVGQIELEY
jgi:putative sigma-54 modulation protein